MQRANDLKHPILRHFTGHILVFSFACIALVGCIGGERRGRDSDVTNDVADGLDSDLDGLDIEEDGDGSDVEVDVVPVVCGDDQGCTGLAGATDCTEWRCVEKLCALVPKMDGFPCEDGSVCTLGDACLSGTCQPSGGTLNCDNLASTQACEVPGCSPTDGCVLVPAQVGTPCDNDRGPVVGSCIAGGFVPTDACDAQGVCADRVPGSAGTPLVPQLGGKWFMVYTSFGGLVSPSTMRAVVDVPLAGNDLTIKALQFMGVNPLGLTTSGFVCSDESGVIEAKFPLGSLNGRHLDGELAVMSSPATDGVAMLVRAGEGTAAMVDGTYTYVQTSIIFGSTTPTTWRGEFTFDRGCLESGVIEPDPTVADVYEYVGAGSDCLEATTDNNDELGLVQLFMNVKAKGQATSVPIFFRGAIGRDGDVLLMVKEERSSDITQRKPEYGTILLVRKPVDTIAPADLTGRWAYAFQKGPSGSARREVGTLEWQDGGKIAPDSLSTLGGETQVLSGWYHYDDATKQMSQRLTFATDSVYQAGYFAPSGRFLVGWSVLAPTTNTTVPSRLGDTPRGGSLLLMLKP